MSNIKLLKQAGLAAAVSLLPLSQVALADPVEDDARASWTLSGWVNEGFTFYDDGRNSDVVQLTDNGATLGTRMTFAGSTPLFNTGLQAGFDITLEPRSGLLGFGTGTTRGVTGEDDFSDTINVLGNSIYVSGDFGKITVGLQSMPTDNIAVLADPSFTLWSSISPIFRGTAVTIQNPAGATNAVWGDFLSCYTAPLLRGPLGIGLDCNGLYLRGVSYHLPVFQLTPTDTLAIEIGAANDDIYDVAAKYKGKFAGRLDALLNIGYAENNGITNSATDPTAAANYSAAENFQVQGGLLDSVTGLFITAAYQYEEADFTAAGRATGANDETDAYWVKGGIKKQWFSMGETALTAQYGSYNDEFSFGRAQAGVRGSEVERIGFSVDQYFGDNLILYGSYEQLDLDDVDCAPGTPCNTVYASTEELDMFTMGLVFFY